MSEFDVVIIGRSASKKFIFAVYNESLDLFQSVGFIDISWNSRNKNRRELGLYKNFKFNSSEDNSRGWPIDCKLKMHSFIYPEHCIKIGTNLIRKSHLHPSGFELCRVEFLSILDNKNCYDVSTIKDLESAYSS